MREGAHKYRGAHRYRGLEAVTIRSTEQNNDSCTGAGVGTHTRYTVLRTSRYVMIDAGF